MAFYTSGVEALRELCKALGIDPDARPVRRIVLDFPANGVAMVYVQRCLDKAELPAVNEVVRQCKAEVKEVAEVKVDERGNVSFKEFLWGGARARAGATRGGDA